MQKLDICSPGITNSAIEHACKTFPELGWLTITECKSVNDDALEQLSRFPKLQALILDNEPITDRGFLAVSKLNALKELRIFGITVSQNGLQSIAGLANLEKLTINGMPLGDDGAFILVANGLPSLKTLDISQCGVSQRVGQSIQAMRPTLTVIR